MLGLEGEGHGYTAIGTLHEAGYTNMQPTCLNDDLAVAFNALLVIFRRAENISIIL